MMGQLTANDWVLLGFVAFWGLVGFGIIFGTGGGLWLQARRRKRRRLERRRKREAAVAAARRRTLH